MARIRTHATRSKRSRSRDHLRLGDGWDPLEQHALLLDSDRRLRQFAAWRDEHGSVWKNSDHRTVNR